MNPETNEEKKKAPAFDLGSIVSDIQSELESTTKAEPKFFDEEQFMTTGVDGFDQLLRHGIPKGSNILVSGGPGSGKTIFCLQLLMHHASVGNNCMFISFEESKERLIKHMKDFGWNPDEYLSAGNLKINRYITTDIYYEEQQSKDQVQAMMSRGSTQYTMDLEPFVIGESGFKPDIIVVDSLSSIASTFVGGQQKYRLYLDKLFRFFETLGSTNFLITETTLAKQGYENRAEDFLADGVIFFYNSRQHNIRESAIEILKMRGASHDKKIVAMNITDKGIVVYPDQEAFSRYD